MTSFDRITQGSIGAKVLSNLQGSLSRLEMLQEQLSSGKRINRPSDEPAGTVLALRLRSSLNRTSQYERNLSDSQGWLNLADSSLQSAVTQLSRARDLTVQGMNGSADSVARSALAAEVRKIRDGVIQVANARYQDRPIFAGTSGASNAYDTSGNFVGDRGKVERNVAPGVTVQVNVDASNAFGSGASSVFAVLENIAQNLEGNGDLKAPLTQLDSAMSALNNALADVGARSNRLETLQSQTQADALNLRSNLSETEDIDITKTIMDLQLQQNSYQAALGATARVIQPSLIDFLR